MSLDVSPGHLVRLVVGGDVLGHVATDLSAEEQESSVGRLVVGLIASTLFELLVQALNVAAQVFDRVHLLATKAAKLSSDLHGRALFLNKVSINDVVGFVAILGHFVLLDLLVCSLDDLRLGALELVERLCALIENVGKLSKVSVEPNSLDPTGNMAVHFLELALAKKFIWNTCDQQCSSLSSAGMLRTGNEVLPKLDKLNDVLANLPADPESNDPLHEEWSNVSPLLDGHSAYLTECELLEPSLSCTRSSGVNRQEEDPREDEDWAEDPDHHLEVVNEHVGIKTVRLDDCGRWTLEEGDDPAKETVRKRLNALFFGTEVGFGSVDLLGAQS